jgi:hypothetical protein
MPTASANSKVPTEAALRVAADIKRAWRAGEHPDAAAALAAHSEIGPLKSVVIDLAYEEYCLRERVGDLPDANQFCARFPRFRTSIRRVLEAHRLVTDRPDLLTPNPIGWPVVGERFEGLALEGELGRGAFGRVFLAFDPETERSCVLKVSSGRSLEARVIASLRHPHVTDIYWARTVGSPPCACPWSGSARSTTFGMRLSRRIPTVLQPSRTRS